MEKKPLNHTKDPLTAEFTNLLSEITDKTEDILNNVQIGDADLRYIESALGNIVDGLKTLKSWI